MVINWCTTMCGASYAWGCVLCFQFLKYPRKWERTETVIVCMLRRRNETKLPFILQMTIAYIQYHLSHFQQNANVRRHGILAHSRVSAAASSTLVRSLICLYQSTWESTEAAFPLQLLAPHLVGWLKGALLSFFEHSLKTLSNSMVKG